MKSSAAKVKHAGKDKEAALPEKLREVIARSGYEAPKVVSFPSNQPQGKTSIPQVTMMGNGF